MKLFTTIVVSLVSAAVYAAESRVVTFEPCGTVTFTNVPAKAFIMDANYAEMVALMGRKVEACCSRGGTYARCVFWDRLPGFSPTNNVTGPVFSNLPGEGGFSFDREFFFKWRPDIVHIDPLQLRHSKEWNAERLEDVRQHIAPFFANRFSRDWVAPRDQPNYQFYTIPEIAEKMAVAYDAEARMAKLLAIVRQTEHSITSRLDGVARPRVALVTGGGRNGSVVPFRLARGNGQLQYRVCRAIDAFDGANLRFYGENGPAGAACDFEALLKINPDVIIVTFVGSMKKDDRQQGMGVVYEEFLKRGKDPVSRHIKAFKNNRVYPGGTPLQGPLVYLFQLEMTAKQLYPQIFGEWKIDGDYSESEQLFSRTEVVRILSAE